MTVNVVRNSVFILIQFDWPDKEEAAIIAGRIQELALEQYEHLRKKISEQALKDLDTSVIETEANLFAAKNKLSESLEKKGIYDIRAEKDNIIREIAALD